MQRRKLIFGCGYLGGRVARRWRDVGHEVFVVTRSSAKASELAAYGLRPIVADVSGDLSLDLPPIDTVLFAVGYDRASAQPIEQVYAGGMKHALDVLERHEAIRRFIYISSTGVYSQNDGQSIDESSPCQPTRPGGKASLAAEDLLRQSRFGSRGIVLRLAGIYGPNRIPRAADLRAGRTIDAPSTGFVNLIHVVDAVEIVQAAEERAVSSLYLVADGAPPTRAEYYRELARSLGAPAPVFSSPAADSPASARAGADKRIDNSRMLRELSVRLRYPTYREGLAAIVGQ